MGLSLGVDKVVGTRNRSCNQRKSKFGHQTGQKFRFLTAVERIKMTEQVLVAVAVVVLLVPLLPLGDPSS
jgi:hypothetical protein